MARFELTPDVLARIADAAEADGGCEEGVVWGRAHVWQDIERGMDSNHASWVLIHLGDQCSARVVDLFVTAAIRRPYAAAAAWHGAKGLRSSHYAALEAVSERHLARWRNKGARFGTGAEPGETDP